MIFATVGTHEQQFNRLIQKLDQLKAEGTITEEVVIQTGYSDYQPKCCEWAALFPYDRMRSYMQEARIVITHGGPSTFIMALQLGKVPIVIPRQHKYREHINNHQLNFVKAVAEEQKNIIPVYDIETLDYVILHYDQIVTSKTGGIISNNEAFVTKFRDIVEELVEEERN